MLVYASDHSSEQAVTHSLHSATLPSSGYL